MLDTAKMLRDLQQERGQIDEAIETIQRLAAGRKRRGRPPNWVKQVEGAPRRGRPPGSKNKRTLQQATGAVQ
jgi:hypothetical protein